METRLWASRPVVLQPEVNGELSGEVYTWGTPLHRSWVRRLVAGLVRLRNLLFRDAAAGVAMSHLIARELASAAFPPERIVLIPHGGHHNDTIVTVERKVATTPAML